MHMCLYTYILLYIIYIYILYIYIYIFARCSKLLIGCLCWANCSQHLHLPKWGWSFGDIADAHAKVSSSSDAYILLPKFEPLQPKKNTQLKCLSQRHLTTELLRLPLALDVVLPSVHDRKRLPVLEFGLALSFFRNPEDLSTFANDAEGFSGADLASLAREAPNKSSGRCSWQGKCFFFGVEDLAETQGCHVGHS